MHVELRREVRVQHTVDVLKMGAASVFVKFVGFGVWPVEMATPGCCPKEVQVLARDKHASLAHQQS